MNFSEDNFFSKTIYIVRNTVQLNINTVVDSSDILKSNKVTNDINYNTINNNKLSCCSTPINNTLINNISTQ